MPKRITTVPNVENANVFIDTNIILSPDPKFIACEEFCNFLEESDKKAKLTIFVPEIVIRERIAKIYHEAKDKLDKVSTSIKSINEYSGGDYSNPATLEQIENQIDNKVRQWFIKHKIIIVKTPYDKINIKEIENYALNHISPFDSETDKGIKDYIIFQTIKEFRKLHPRKRFVFLCNDKRFNEAFADYAKNQTNIEYFDNVGAFLNIINMKHENFSKQRIKNLSIYAKKLFYNFEKDEGLYNEFKIWEKISEKYSELINKPLDVVPSIAVEDFEILDSNITLNDPIYLKQENGEYVYSSELSVERKLAKENDYSIYTNLIKFEIKWAMTISRKIAYSKPRLISINVKSKSQKKEPNFKYLEKLLTKYNSKLIISPHSGKLSISPSNKQTDNKPDPLNILSAPKVSDNKTFTVGDLLKSIKKTE